MPDWTQFLDKGVIIKACFGPRGDWKRLRPAVVLTANEFILQRGGLLVVVGSTESRKPAIEVELTPGAYTGLNETTFITGDWQIMMAVGRVDEVCRNVPPAYMLRILATLRGEPELLPSRP